jgi:hypothetical protein
MRLISPGGGAGLVADRCPGEEGQPYSLEHTFAFEVLQVPPAATVLDPWRPRSRFSRLIGGHIALSFLHIV